MKRSVFTYVLAASSVLVSNTQAQINSGVEEIVVTAERRAESIQDVPISISAFSTDTMENLGIDSALDLGAAVPNLRTTQVTGGTAAMQISMRGANVQIPGLNTSESPVGIYTDGVYRGRLAASNMDYMDIERIEVLRGPQGTLYGRNTLAGAIKIISRVPEDEAWANAKIGYGRWNALNIGGSVGAPIQEGSSAASLAFNFTDQSEGFIENPTLGNRGGSENFSARSKLHLYGNESVDVVLAAFVESAESDGYLGVPYDFNGEPVAGFYTNLSPSEEVNSSETDTWGVSSDVTFELSDSVSLRSITAFQDIEDVFDMDLSGAGAVLVNAWSETDQLTQEFQALGSALDEKLTWLAGIYFMQEEGEQSYGISDFFFVESTTTETNSLSFFAEGTYSFTDKLSLTLGIRRTEDDKQFTYDLSSNAPDYFELDETFSSTTPKLGIDYKFNDDLLLYFTASSGFQAGGFQTLTFGNSAVARQFYKPMEVDSYELGVKSDFLDKRLRINLNAFYAAYEDLQATVFAFGGFPQLNIGDVDVEGLELEVYAAVTDGLDLFLTGGYAKDDIDSEFLDSDIRLPATPETTARFGFNYSAASWFKFGADYEYSDEYFASVNNTLVVEEVTRLNAYVALAGNDEKWELRLSAKNLTGEEDIVAGLTFPNIRTPLPQRSWVTTFKYQF